jgi:hypothetical protein
MVSSLAAAISDVGLDAADHHLDCEHYPHLRHVALAHTWASVGGASWLGNAAGIRMRRDRRDDNGAAPDQTSLNTSDAPGSRSYSSTVASCVHGVDNQMRSRS